MDEKHKKSAKTFIKTFAFASVLILLAIGGMSYYIDPFFQFRIKDNAYLLNPRFVNPGLAKNYDYNTVIIGSSMVQNFDMSILRRDANVKPVKLGSGAMNVTEMLEVYSLVKKEQTQSMIINIDVTQFALHKEQSKYPAYLCNPSMLNTLEYMYGYETCVRYLPVDFALRLYSNIEPLPASIKEKASIDDIGNFVSISQYNKQVVKDLYLSGNTVTHHEAAEMPERLSSKFDLFMNEIAIDQNKDIEYTFILPPYSALYWQITSWGNYYEIIKDFVRQMTKEMEKHPNAKIAFFYDIDEITNLDNYCDVTHFSPAISDKILENINNPDYVLSSSNIEQRFAKMDSLMVAFSKENSDWIYIKK